QPLASPPVPAAAPLPTRSLTRPLARAGLISAGVLILLLGGVFWYARRARRRESRLPGYPALAPALAPAPALVPALVPAPEDRARPAQSATPVVPGSSDNRTEADKLLEYFATPPSTPPAASRKAWASAAAAARSQNRQARVSGTPPWEPASEPATELPWTGAPGPSAGSASDSIWPVSQATPGPSSAISQSWDELAASASAGTSAGDPASPPGPGRPLADDLLAEEPVFGPLADFPPAASTAVHGTPVPWVAPSTPRSPSGSNWEALSDDEA
ncbi:MAG: hypothetical protein ACRDNZ_06420, partial [Streptosporangiaceae bacterium]